MVIWITGGKIARRELDMRHHPDPQHLWWQSFCNCQSRAMEQFTATSQRCWLTILFGQWGHGTVWTILAAPSRNNLTYLLLCMSYNHISSSYSCTITSFFAINLFLRVFCIFSSPVSLVFHMLSILCWIGCQYQCMWLTGRLKNMQKWNTRKLKHTRMCFLCVPGYDQETEWWMHRLQVS